MKNLEPQIFSYAFYGNSLSLQRDSFTEGVVASGSYTTRYGTVHLYGESWGKNDERTGFSFDFTYEGRNYRCWFAGWLSDQTIRRRALRFVERCRVLHQQASND